MAGHIIFSAEFGSVLVFASSICAQLSGAVLLKEHQALQERPTVVDADGLASAAGINECTDGSLSKTNVLFQHGTA